ncbi:MAG: hypothetical protein Q9217_005556 [Psora testacea]
MTSHLDDIDAEVRSYMENLTEVFTNNALSHEQIPLEHSSRTVLRFGSGNSESYKMKPLPKPKDEKYEKDSEVEDLKDDNLDAASHYSHGKNSIDLALSIKGKGREVARLGATAATSEDTKKTEPKPSDEELVPMDVSPPSMLRERSKDMQMIRAGALDRQPPVPLKYTPRCPCGDPLCLENVTDNEHENDAQLTTLPPTSMPSWGDSTNLLPLGLPSNPRDKVRLQKIGGAKRVKPLPALPAPEPQRVPASQGDFLTIRRQLARINMDIGGLRIGGLRGVSSGRRAKSIADEADERRLGGKGNVSAWLKRGWSKHVRGKSTH